MASAGKPTGTNPGGRGLLGSRGGEMAAWPMQCRVLQGHMALYEDY